MTILDVNEGKVMYYHMSQILIILNKFFIIVFK